MPPLLQLLVSFISNAKCLLRFRRRVFLAEWEMKARSVDSICHREKEAAKNATRSQRIVVITQSICSNCVESMRRQYGERSRESTRLSFESLPISEILHTQIYS